MGKSIEFSDDALTEADAVMIVTDHSDIDYDRVKEQAKVLVDTRAATRSSRPERREAATTA